MYYKIKKSFKKNSKTFYFASFFLNKKTSYYSYVLYNFCRIVDDIADKKTTLKRHKLNQIIVALNKETTPKQPFLLEIKKLVEKKVIHKEPLIELIQGVLTDTKHVHVKSIEQLINYSYLVAGTVGIMMCRIFNNTNLYSFKYAVDLGIAMQLTNILRDILEDARMNRVYLPYTWIKVNTSKIITQDNVTRKKLMLASNKLFLLSEKYYNSAFLGLAFLPYRPRFAILLALITYRQIGRKIIKKKFSNLDRREIITLAGKIRCLIIATIIYITNFKIHLKYYKHDIALHNKINKRSFLFKLKA